MCSWFPPRTVTGFDCRVTAELRSNALWRSRERILSRDRDEGDVARKAISLDAETSRFNSNPQVVQVPTRVLELLETRPPQRAQVFDVFLALTLIVLRPYRLAVLSMCL